MLVSTRTITEMVESVDNSSSQGNESSDYNGLPTPELSTSSESSSEEQSCSRGKGKGPVKTTKTLKGNASSNKSAPSRKKQKIDDNLNAE